MDISMFITSESTRKAHKKREIQVKRESILLNRRVCFEIEREREKMWENEESGKF